MDEVLLYERALSATEVGQIFAEQNPVPEPGTGLLVTWGLAAIGWVRHRAPRC